VLLDVQCLRLKREVGSPEQNIFGTRIFLLCFILRYDTENELFVVLVPYFFLFILGFFSDGIFQISVTNIDHPSNFKPL